MLRTEMVLAGDLWSYYWRSFPQWQASPTQRWPPIAKDSIDRDQIIRRIAWRGPTVSANPAFRKQDQIAPDTSPAGQEVYGIQREGLGPSERCGADPRAFRCLRTLICLLATVLVQPLFSRGICQSTSPSRDPAAMQIIQVAIQSMGGQALWSTVSKAQAQWQVSRPHSPEYSATGHWIDDWSLGFDVFEHKTEAADGTHSIRADALHDVINYWPQGQKTLPRKLQDIAIPLYLPASSLLIALSDPQTSVQYRGLSTSGGNLTQVSLVKVNARGFQDPLTKEEWTFDMSNGYPTQLIYYTEDLAHGTPHRETIQYADYQAQGPFIVPTTLNCNSADDAVVLRLATLHLN